MAESSSDSDGFGERNWPDQISTGQLTGNGDALFEDGYEHVTIQSDKGPMFQNSVLEFPAKNVLPVDNNFSSSSKPSFRRSLEDSVKAGLPNIDIPNNEVGPMEKDIFNNQLRSARIRCLPESLKQPWEKGFGAALFGTRTLPSFLPNSFLVKSIPLPPINVRESKPDSQSRSLAPALWKRPVLSSATLKIRRISLSDEYGDPLKFRAIERWRTIVFLDLNASLLGRQLVEYVLDGRAESLIAQTLSDAFLKKSNSTLLKRSGSILKYVQFCLAHFKVTMLSYRESWLYSYLCFLRTTNASPSSGKSFLEALNFAIHVIGIDVFEAGWKSARVSGVADSMYIKKAPLHQSDALFVSEVRLLHHILSNSNSTLEKVIAGYCLLDLYGTSRWSDPQRPVRVLYDVKDGYGYLELGTTTHKMASTAERKTVIFPVVATSPGLGRDDPCWIDEWMQAREESGLELIQNPTLPQVLSNGTFGTEPMTASEGSMWIKDLLQSYGPKIDPARKITSHSLKATLLSWAAKRPLKKSVRRALGHHLDSSDTSVATYSRDFLYAALVSLDKLLEEIRSGKFDPDSSRAVRASAKKSKLGVENPKSSLWSKKRKADGGLVYVAEDPLESGSFSSGDPSSKLLGSDVIISEKEVDATADSDSSSDENSSSSSSSEASIQNAADEEITLSALLDQTAVRTADLFRDSDGKPIDVYQHTTSGMLHARGELNKLLCGRVVSASFSRIRLDLKMRWPKCEVCSRRSLGTKFLPPKPKACPAPPLASP